MGRGAIDYENPAYKGLSDAQMAKKEAEDTKEALKEHNVILKEDHMDGYFRNPKKLEKDKFSVVRPWEADVMANIPTMKAIYTLESWANDECKFTVSQGIAYITLNRPAANNAMNDGITSGMNDAVHILRERPDIRVAVLTGEGRMFCAGGDPKSFQSFQGVGGPDGPSGPPPGQHIVGAAGSIEGNKLSGHSFAKFLYDFAALPQFTICCANGSAMGGGFGLVCICDICIAVKQAMFVLSEVKLGVIPATISPHVIGKIGVANSKRLFCTAENCNMKKAMQMGLVQQTVDNVGEFDAAVKEHCDRLRGCAPGAVASAKSVMLKYRHAAVNESLIQNAAQEYARIRKGEEAESAMKALQAKQKPSWMQQEIKLPSES
eukprot:gnl/TRDRNA2_/TRDRNA2_173872_c0_seq1.p1 gnl/TRDRNA2_/TRDRNA2_173872_c0~~gnl/TRDRNA2_/TRDRNA2_173872_c0_seq1.p1  ORF type:complete len:377 (-),score=107.86 gnl/TRDRNA2_/TRDRNA2_173872_c0_seq1:193-1323(-)